MMDGATFAKLCRSSGVGLPYPDVPASHLRIVVGALEEAWRRLHALPGVALSALDEDQTTTLLEQQLHGLLGSEDVAGFSPEFFHVTRDSKVVSFDGNHPDKMPDLSFLLMRTKPGIPSDYALHVECKPVNAAIGMSPYYGDDGMGCFIRGDYGSKMRSGLMVAYAQQGYTFQDKIAPVLVASLADPAHTLAVTRLPPRPPVPESHHRRAWTYANGRAPGDIKLLHVWLTIT